MNAIFKECLRKFVLVFYDDILVYSRTAEERQLHLWNVLQILETQALFANVKKCSFGQSNITYLGHIILVLGVANTSKIEMMLNWPLPHSLKELHGFLGLTGYYWRFVAHYDSIDWPLTEPLKKDSFHWGLNADATFQALKIVVSNVLVLALPDFSCPFVVETDASGVGIGVVLYYYYKRNDLLPSSAKLFPPMPD